MDQSRWGGTAIHFRRHEGAVRPDRLFLPKPRGRQGHEGDADAQTPLAVLARDDGPPQARGRGYPGHPPAYG